MKKLLTELDKIILKCKWKHKRPKSGNMILGQGCYVVCVKILDFKAHCRAMVTKTTQEGRKLDLQISETEQSLHK